MHLKKEPTTVEKVPLGIRDGNTSFEYLPSAGKEKAIMMRKRTISTFGQEGKTELKTEVKPESMIDIGTSEKEADGVVGLLELADAVISFNKNSMNTLPVAYGMYKVALREHQRLPSKQ